MEATREQTMLPPIEMVDAVKPDQRPAAIAHLLAMTARIVAQMGSAAGAKASAERPYTLSEAAALASRSRAWLRRKAKTEGVPGARKLGKAWVFARAPFHRWIGAS